MFGYPSASAHKLHSRREKCNAAQLEMSSSSEADDSIASPEDCSAYQSDLVTVASSSGLGRHVRVSTSLFCSGSTYIPPL